MPIPDIRFVEDSENAPLRHDILFLNESSPLANREMLEQARQMRREGRSREDIWRDTGWWERMPGRWFFETDDRAFAENRRVIAPGRFFDHFSHPDLPRGAPGVENLRVYPYRAQITGEGGEHTPGRGVGIATNADPKLFSPGTVGIHELQHAIDSSYGMNPRGIGQLLEREGVAHSVNERRAWAPERRRATPPWVTMEGLNLRVRDSNTKMRFVPSEEQ